MTGYLQNLARRTADDAPFLRPRLPSQFEPNTYALAQTSADHLNRGDDKRTSRSEHVPWESEAPESLNSDELNPPTSDADNLHAPSVLEKRRTSKQREPKQSSTLTRQRVQTERNVSDRGEQEHRDMGTKTRHAHGTTTFEIQHDSKREDQTGTSSSGSESALPTKPTASLSVAEIVPITLDSQRPEKTRSQLPNTEPRRESPKQTEEDNTQSDSRPTSQRRRTRLSQVSTADDIVSDGSVIGEKQTDIPTVEDKTALPMPALDLQTVCEHGTHRKSVLAIQQVPTNETPPESPVPTPLTLQPVLPGNQQIPSKAIDNRAPQRTVQVTIGRIEIKAVSADERPLQPRRDRSSVMSLDEYLNRHAMGSN